MTAPPSLGRLARWPRGHRVEAAVRALPIGSVAELDQGEKPGQPCYNPGAGGGVVMVPRLCACVEVCA
jgi:hypothetical protein